MELTRNVLLNVINFFVSYDGEVCGRCDKVLFIISPSIGM